MSDRGLNSERVAGALHPAAHLAKDGLEMAHIDLEVVELSRAAAEKRDAAHGEEVPRQRNCDAT